MQDVEDLLKAKKIEIDKLDVPDELESRLRSALNKTNKHRGPKKHWIAGLAAVLVFILLAGYHSDTLAFYGKKLIGYEGVMNGTLQELNELRKGQSIGKSYHFENGMTLTLDGIMLDDNQLLAFYSIKKPQKYPDDYDYPIYIEGLFGKQHYYMHSSTGEINEDKTAINYIASFAAPRSSEKTLDFTFSLQKNGRDERGQISFDLDRSKAMGHKLKKTLNHKIKLDEAKIHFRSITASPTTTVIEGSIQNIMELAIDQITENRIRPDCLKLKLIANGKEVPLQSSGMSTDMKGITFHQEFDALPADLKQLQIQVLRFGADHDVDKKIELKKSSSRQSLEILGQKIDVNKVYESQGDTYLSISTEESVLLSRLYLIMDGKKVHLEETITEKHNKEPDGKITHTRTLHFPGTGKDLQLNIERIRYDKTYSKVINVPVN